MSHSIDETYEVYDETFPKARKDHECEACGLTIRRGDQYARVGIVFNGEGETVKRCLRCQRIHEHLRRLGYRDDMWPAERLDCGESYEEHWGELPLELARVAFMTDDEAQRELAPRPGRTSP